MYNSFEARASFEALDRSISRWRTYNSSRVAVDIQYVVLLFPPYRCLISTTVAIAILYKVLCWFGEHLNLTYRLMCFSGTCETCECRSWGELKTRLGRGAEIKPTCRFYNCKTWHKHWNMLTTGLTHLILPKNNAFVWQNVCWWMWLSHGSHFAIDCDSKQQKIIRLMLIQ